MRANQRTTYGSFEASIPSRFLGDLPERLVQRQGYTGYHSQSTSWRQSERPRPRRWESGGTRLAPSSSRYNSPPEPQPPAVQQQFKAGNRVRHPKWGEGLVVDARIDLGEERVDVFFDSVGFKRLIASLANLEIIQE